jgi:hypothetical protein
MLACLRRSGLLCGFPQSLAGADRRLEAVPRNKRVEGLTALPKGRCDQSRIGSTTEERTAVAVPLL